MIYQFRYKGVLIRFAFPKQEKRYRFDRILLFLPGLPSYPGQPSFLNTALRLGVGVVMPQYLGSYQSDGTFTPQGCIETVKRSVEFLKSKHAVELYGKTKISWDYDDIILGGTSFGGYVVMASLNHAAFQKLFLVAPLLYLAPTNHLPKLGDPILHRLEFVKDVYGHVYRGAVADLKVEANDGAGFEVYPVARLLELSVAEREKERIVPILFSERFYLPLYERLFL